MKNLFVKYKCQKCGYEMIFNHGQIEEVPEHWKETTCMNLEARCSEWKNPIDKNGNPKLPRKTAKLIKSWKE